MEKKIYITIMWHELETLVAKSYGLDKFEIIELENDSDYAYKVDKTELKEYAVGEVQKAINQGWIEEWRLSSILDDLASKGFLEEGNYLMHVCW